MGTRSTYFVEGMTCDHCVRAVRTEVLTLPGVVDVDVKLSTGEITVDSEGPLEDHDVRAAVEEAGYELAAR